MVIVSKYLIVKVRQNKLGQFTKIQKKLVGVSLSRELKKILMAKGPVTFWALLALFVVSGSLTLSSDIWLGVWGKDLFKFQNRFMNLYVYIGLAFSGVVFVVFRDLIFRSR